MQCMRKCCAQRDGHAVSQSSVDTIQAASPLSPARPLPTHKIWRCACGEVELTFRGEPAFVFNCHCRSCVAIARYCDAKAGGRNTSILTSGGGVAKAMYYLEDVDIPQGLAQKLEYVKVGITGSVVRSYTKCCGTVLNSAGGKGFPTGFRPFNRNCILNADGTQYMCKAPVDNVLARFAFAPEAVPEPKSALASTHVAWRFTTGILSYRLGWSGLGELENEETFFADPRNVSEVVPITWK